MTAPKGAVLIYVLQKVSRKVSDFDSFLSHGISVSDCDRVVGKSVEVDSDTERSANFVLGEVTFADVTSFVQNDTHVFFE